MVNRVRSSKNFFLSTIIRTLLFLLIAIILFSVGLMIGYSVIGEGGDPADIFKQETWQKIIDFVQ
ncbi:DNA-directed RNA polymerase subunit beta [Granulicatella seriolae]|uniref:DNA-directed RNA polymerase subunit beta n=1 Tax=Granulicatella seriolae TaxID=2967226 RepID=A0ABT1WKY6_9LACT|nr:DNA-directed RNA polymerase subunit beta [Granulicatella seriolae]